MITSHTSATHKDRHSDKSSTFSHRQSLWPRGSGWSPNSPIKVLSFDKLAWKAPRESAWPRRWARSSAWSNTWDKGRTNIGQPPQHLHRIENNLGASLSLNAACAQFPPDKWGAVSLQGPSSRNPEEFCENDQGGCTLSQTVCQTKGTHPSRCGGKNSTQATVGCRGPSALKQP